MPTETNKKEWACRQSARKKNKIFTKTLQGEDNTRSKLSLPLEIVVVQKSLNKQHRERKRDKKETRWLVVIVVFKLKTVKVD